MNSHRSSVPWGRVALCSGLGIAWVVLMDRFHDGDVYSVLGAYSGMVVCALLLLERKRLRTWLGPGPKPIVLGLVLGGVSTLLTYPAYDLAATLWPPLEGHVAVLYREAAQDSTAARLGWIGLIIAAEELLFRGFVLDLLRSTMSTRWAAAVAVAVYAAAQLGSGSWIVFGMALTMGTLWTVLRIRTGSLLAPLVAHGIWTPVTIILYPVL